MPRGAGGRTGTHGARADVPVYPLWRYLHDDERIGIIYGVRRSERVGRVGAGQGAAIIGRVTQRTTLSGGTLLHGDV